MVDMTIHGLPVKDAAKPLTVTITATDVELGSSRDARECAAAVALCRQTGADEARVHLSRVYVRRGKKWTRYQAPPALRQEIVTFDRGGAFEPGEYTLKPVQPSAHINSEHRKKYRKKYVKPEAPRHKNSVRPVPKPHVITGVRRNMGPHGDLDSE